MPPVSLSRIPFLLDEYLASALPDTPIAFQGARFNPARQSGLWVRPVCKSGAMQDSEKGPDGLSRRSGLYLVDLIAPLPLDAADIWDKAAQVESAFRRRCVGGIETQDPATDNRGVDTHGAFILRVTVPWWCWA